MASQDLEQRVATLERQVRELMSRLEDPTRLAPTAPLWPKASPPFVQSPTPGALPLTSANGKSVVTAQPWLHGTVGDATS